jgi:TPR repeat protein
MSVLFQEDPKKKKKGQKKKGGGGSTKSGGEVVCPNCHITHRYQNYDAIPTNHALVDSLKELNQRLPLQAKAKASQQDNFVYCHSHLGKLLVSYDTLCVKLMCSRCKYHKVKAFPNSSVIVPLSECGSMLYQKIMSGSHDAVKLLEALSSHPNYLHCKGYLVMLLYSSRIFAVIPRDIPRAHQLAREFLETIKNKGITVSDPNQMSRLSVHERYLAGRMLYEGLGTSEDPRPGFKMIMSAAIELHPHAMVFQGTNYPKNSKNKLIHEQAKVQLELAAEQMDHPEAYCALGTYYMTGDSLYPQNTEIAVSFYRHAATAGLAEAQHLLAKYYESISNFDEAMRLWLLAAEQGYTDAIIALCYQYFHTQRAYDLCEGLRWFRRSVELGDPEVIQVYSFIVESGYCEVPKDPVEVERLSEMIRNAKMNGERALGRNRSPVLAWFNLLRDQEMSKTTRSSRFIDVPHSSSREMKLMKEEEEEEEVER